MMLRLVHYPVRGILYYNFYCCHNYKYYKRIMPMAGQINNKREIR